MNISKTKKQQVNNNILNILLTFFLTVPFAIYCDTGLKINRVNHIKQKLAGSPAYAVDGFIFPVGPPNAKGYYNAQKFGERNRRFNNNFHLGEDWNGIGGGNSDLGDPVFTVANGMVVLVERNYPGWGNVVIIAHRQPGKEIKNDRFIESVYGHLDKVFVKEGDFVKRSTKIGTIGNAGGLYLAHLHFELRSGIGLTVGGGYSDSLEGFLNPTEYIRKHFYNGPKR